MLDAPRTCISTSTDPSRRQEQAISRRLRTSDMAIPSTARPFLLNTKTAEMSRKLKVLRNSGPRKLAGQQLPLPDKVRKADSVKGVAGEVQAGNFADDGLDAGDASAMADGVLRQ